MAVSWCESGRFGQPHETAPRRGYAVAAGVLVVAAGGSRFGDIGGNSIVEAASCLAAAGGAAAGTRAARPSRCPRGCCCTNPRARAVVACVVGWRIWSLCRGFVRDRVVVGGRGRRRRDRGCARPGASVNFRPWAWARCIRPRWSLSLFFLLLWLCPE